MSQTNNPNKMGDTLKSTGDDGNAMAYHDSCTVAAASANADVYRPCRVAGGTKVHRVVVKNTDLDSNATPLIACKIGFRPVDGSAQASGDDTAVASAQTILQSAATTTFEIFPTFLVTQDAFLEIVVTTGPGTGATGTIYGKVEGEGIGVK